jgi:hypothetical protein
MTTYEHQRIDCSAQRQIVGTFIFTCFLVTPCRGRALALLALGEAEEAGLAPGALPADDVRLAVALTAHLGAVVAHASRAVASAVQRAAVEVGANANDCAAAIAYVEER